MTGEARFCPQCGTRRVGFFRFCPKDGLDYDELLAPEQRRPADPKASAPTKSSVVSATDLRQAALTPPPAARPAAPVPVAPGGPGPAADAPPPPPATAPRRASAPAAAAAAV